jgi:ATP-dependent Clp protease ATP-binding subunit ClpB
VICHFRPEFLNRIDDIIVFNPLTANEIKQIVSIQLHLLEQRLSDRQIKLSITESAKEQLAAIGYDPTYGARPLKRAIQNHVLNPLSKEILQGRINDGDSVSVDYRDGAFTFERSSVGASKS